MLSFPTQTRYWIVPLIVSAISLIGFLCEPVSGSLFAFEREAIMDLEIWRLISGHFLHTNLAHLVLKLKTLKELTNITIIF